MFCIRKYVLIAGLICTAMMCEAQIIEPVKWKFSTQKVDAQTIELHFDATIEAGWHLYGMAMPEGGPLPTRFVFENQSGVTFSGEVTGASELIEAYDPLFELTLNWYAKKARFVQRVKVTPDVAYHVSGYVKYQSCNDEACISDEANFLFTAAGKAAVAETLPDVQDQNSVATPSLPVGTAQAKTGKTDTAKDIYTPVIEQLRNFDTQGSVETRSYWVVFLLGLLGGFVALLTPCVWPIIPMTVSFFLKRGNDTRRGRQDAIFYGLSIVIIYLVLGIAITLIFGASALNSLSTNAFFNLLFFALLLLFAISFFGAFELTLPESWTSKLNAKAETTSGLLSILLMAFTLVLVSFSCTGPIIGTLLVEVATTGSMIAPMIGMTGFAIALALPFSLFAFFPTALKNMPKSGSWLNAVKVVLGFLEVALALKFLSVADLSYGWGILDRETFLALWIVIFALLGFYLLGKIRFPHDDKIERVSVPRFGMALISLAFAVYMIPGLWGAPLKAISAFSPPMHTQDFNLYTDEVRAQFYDYETGMIYAKNQGKPVMIDFTGFGCVNCRKMELAVWTDGKVRDIINKDYVLITLYVDDKKSLPAPIEVTENGKQRTLRTIGDKNSYLQRHKFGANAQPFYVLLNNSGEPLTGAYAFDEDIDKYVRFLKVGLENYK
ncbi:MAG: thioredoxin family protein [Prevotellaceae bacterium]|jgi:thiol:disulfide interchange protein DsbD|nr:thioredoxin family protein [Prevotellaceae bacterium]